MSHSKALCYEFGQFRFNVAQRLLTRAGEVISLGPKASETLFNLLRNAGEIVAKEDLMQEVWPDAFVEESNLTQNIFTLRRALGDTRTEARFIETVARRGYRFVAAVSVSEDGVSATESSENVLGESPILAVLPFVNATGDEGLEYLAEGVCENVINSLSHISKLRVMSRSAVFRYKGRDIEPRTIYEDLGVDVLLLGKIVSPPSGLRINAVLVNAATGWQIWGESFRCELDEILEIQDEIVRQISAALGVKISGDEERQITARYTENSSAYQAYIEGRFYWSRYTRSGIEKAIERFCKAIQLDQNYALAYAGIVDCYLRLATNYLPPDCLTKSEQIPQLMRAEQIPLLDSSTYDFDDTDQSIPVVLPLLSDASDAKVKLRHEWDWKGAEREIRRANELRAEYPAAHQWHAAHLFVRNLFSRSEQALHSHNQGVSQRIPFSQLAPNEEIQVYCAIAREQVDVGNYEAACLVLNRWWTLGTWPKLAGLDLKSCADLLFTAGEVEGFVASSLQLPRGQKNAESLLSGSLALFDQLGSFGRLAEARMELALCYYRQGNFDLGRTTFSSVLNDLPTTASDIRCLALIRLASLERHAGRLQKALNCLGEAKSIIQTLGPWVSGRHHLEMASTLKELAISEGEQSLFEDALAHYQESRYEFEAIGNLRLMGIAENNIGSLFLTRNRPSSAQTYLQRAHVIFEALNDKVRLAQVDDTLARFHLSSSELELAKKAVTRATSILQSGDESALLAEVLTTKGLVCSKLQQFREAVRTLESAHAVAARCGDHQGAALALLILLEEVGDSLSLEERRDVEIRLQELSLQLESRSIRARVDRSLNARPA